MIFCTSATHATRIYTGEQRPDRSQDCERRGTPGHTMLVIGGRDLDAGAVSIRLHGKRNIGAKPEGEVVMDILAEIKERRA